MKTFLQTPSIQRLLFLSISLSLILFPLSACQSSAKPTSTQSPTTKPTLSVVEKNTETVTETPVQADTAAPATSYKFVPVKLDQPGTPLILQESKELPPSEVLREVSYSGGYGGGGGGCSNLENQPSVPTILISDNDHRVEWGQEISYLVCGWQPKENVWYRIISPQGKIIHEEQIQSDESFGFPDMYFSADLNAPPGDYRLTFTGQKETVETKITVSTPSVPRMYLQKNKLILYNFQPEEPVQLFVYWTTDLVENTRRMKAPLLEWKDYTTDTTGQLVLDIDDKAVNEKGATAFYVALGKVSGEVHLFPKMADKLMQNIYSALGFTIDPTNSNSGSKVKNIWDLLKYQDLYSPGEKTYSLSIQSADVIRWRFAWCTIDKDTLDQNLKGVSVEFWANGEKVDPYLIEQTTMTSANSWPCKRWATILSNWKPGSKHTLEIRYTLQNTISDGKSTFQAGDYRQVVNLEVK